ncbi:hypothetical protein J6590_058155 [Homalodisca vitripennis]|nr:hypothetical protein J6590_058155 [Homalodisca vitripennis]
MSRCSFGVACNKVIPDPVMKTYGRHCEQTRQENQAIARSKVFRVVSDLELAKYTVPSSVSTTPSGSSLASWTPAPASFECDQFRDSTSQQYVWMGDG